MIDLLVIGGGLLGREVGCASREFFDTALTYNTNPVNIEGCQAYQMDISQSVELIRSLSPEYIVLTVAVTNVDGCELDREHAWKVNALGAKNVAEAAHEIGSRLIYVSTDYVFDGLRGMYKESDEASPINYYGESKLGGERFVQEVCPDSVIARTSVLYGWNPLRLNFVTWVADELRKGNCINVVTGQYTSPTFAGSMAQMMLSILDEKGIFHTCGSERINRYDLAMKVAEAFGLDCGLINPVTSDRLDWKARRPADSSLDCSRISDFAKPLSVEEGLKAIIESEVVVNERPCPLRRLRHAA